MNSPRNNLQSSDGTWYTIHFQTHSLLSHTLVTAYLPSYHPKTTTFPRVSTAKWHQQHALSLARRSSRRPQARLSRLPLATLLSPFPARPSANNLGVDMPQSQQRRALLVCTLVSELYSQVALVTTSTPRVTALSSLALRARRRASSHPSLRTTRRYTTRSPNCSRTRTSTTMEAMVQSWFDWPGTQVEHTIRRLELEDQMVPP